MSNYGKPVEEIETRPVFTVKDLLEKTQCGVCFNSHAQNMSFDYDTETDRFKSFGFHDINCDVNGDDVSFYFIGKYIEAINMLSMEVSYIDTADYDVVAFGVVNDDDVPVVEVKRSLDEELSKIENPAVYKSEYLQSSIKVPEGTTFKDMGKIAKKFFGDEDPKVHVYAEITDVKSDIAIYGLPMPSSLFKIDGVYYGYTASTASSQLLPSKLKSIDDLKVKENIDFRAGTMHVTVLTSSDNFEKCEKEPEGEREYGDYRVPNNAFPFTFQPGACIPFSNSCTSNPAVLRTYTVKDAIELCNGEEYKIVNYNYDHDIDPDDVYTLTDNVWVTPTKYLFALGHDIDANNEPVPVGWITKYRYDFTNEAMMTRPVRFRVKIDGVNVIFIDRPFCPTHAQLEPNDHYFNKRIEVPGYLNFKARSVIFDYLEKECGTLLAKVYLDNKGFGLKSEEKFGLTLDEDNHQCFKSPSGKVIYLEDDVEDTRVTAFTVGNCEVLDYTGELFVTGRLLTEEN